MNILIKNVLVLNDKGEGETTAIAIEDDKIKSVGAVPTDFVAAETIDGTDMLAVPGFVNAHTHASMTLLRSFADDMELMPWLQKIWPIEDLMTPEDLYWGAMLAAAEMIRSGTTTFADMYGPFMDKVAEATIESGLRGVLSRGIVGVAPGFEDKLDTGVKLYRDYHGAQGRITVMMSPHAIYTCTEEQIKKIAATAQKLGADVHIHMSETADEVENCLKEHGKRPFAYVESTRLFESGTLAAHCVHLDDEDIGIIKKRNIHAVHNPGSNMKLASGVAPVQRLLSEGVCVALGTDGASSNNNLDMLEEIRLAALLGKIETGDPTAIPATTALKMGTEYGAKAVGLDNVGALKPGYQADITLFSLKSPCWHPRHNLASLLVYSAASSSVDTVLVAGRVLLRKGAFTLLDEERVLFEASRAAYRLCGK